MSRDSDVVTTREELLASRSGAWMQLNTHNALHSPRQQCPNINSEDVTKPCIHQWNENLWLCKKLYSTWPCSRTHRNDQCDHLPHHEVYASAHITANVTASITAWLGQHSRQRPSLLHIDVDKWTNNSFKLTQMDPNWLLKGLRPSWGQSGGLFLEPCICIQHFPGPGSILPVFSGRNKC